MVDEVFVFGKVADGNGYIVQANEVVAFLQPKPVVGEADKFIFDAL